MTVCEHRADAERAPVLTAARAPAAGALCLGLAELRRPKHNSHVRTAGLVTMRQRLDTASGTVFVTLKDEDGSINVIVWPDLAKKQRRELVGSQLLLVDGRWEQADGVRHLIARRLHDRMRVAG